MNITYYVNYILGAGKGYVHPHAWTIRVNTGWFLFGGMSSREDTSIPHMTGHLRGEDSPAMDGGLAVMGVSFKSRIDHWGEPKTLQGTIIYPIPRSYQDMLKMIFLFPRLDMLVSGRVMILKRLLYKDLK